MHGITKIQIIMLERGIEMVQFLINNNKPKTNDSQQAIKTTFVKIDEYYEFEINPNSRSSQNTGQDRKKQMGSDLDQASRQQVAI